MLRLKFVAFFMSVRIQFVQHFCCSAQPKFLEKKCVEVKHYLNDIANYFISLAGIEFYVIAAIIVIAHAIQHGF